MQDLENSRPSTDDLSYIGIDVSKSHLDIFIHPEQVVFRLSNDKQGHRQLNQRLKNLEVSLVVMEATGKYHRAAHRSLVSNGVEVAVVNPFRTRAFANSLGRWAKNDAIDAKMLALYGAMTLPRSVQPASKVLEGIKELVGACQNAKVDRARLSNQLGESKVACVRARLKARIRQLDRHIAGFDSEIMRLIEVDPAMAQRFSIITSVPGLGPVNAATMIAEMPELGSCDEKQIAALAGVAPMVRQSGSFTGKAHIRGGRKAVRNLLYMAALSAIRAYPEMKSFKNRLMSKSKEFKCAITAVMRKLIVLINVLIRENRKWNPIAP